MILADGARAQTFEKLLAAGDLPAISEHVVERGCYRRATTTFTSTTGPAHIPLLSGCFPGTANIPGYRWFDRERYRGWGPAAPSAFRSYNGPEASRFEIDMDSRVKTLYELIDDSVGVYGMITRGLDPGRNLLRRRKAAIWAHSHFFHDYRRADRSAAAALLDAVSIRARFRFVAFPGIDWNCHYLGVDGPEAIAAYGRIDAAVGAVAARLQRSGAYEQTLILLVSDHGHCRVDQHFDFPVELASRLGLRTAYHSFPAFRPRFDALAGVSGNGMAMAWLRGERPGWRGPGPDRDRIERDHPGLIGWLLERGAIDLVITRDGYGGQIVESRRGRARLVEAGTGPAVRIEYEPLDGDPFGWELGAATLGSREALEQTAGLAYPDGLLQITQLFRSARCGDLVVSATPGFDLRERFERPEHRSSHGALHRDHMLVPFASSEPLYDGPLRTADIAPTVLDYLGLAAPPVIDGSTRLI